MGLGVGKVRVLNGSVWFQVHMSHVLNLQHTGVHRNNRKRAVGSVVTNSAMASFNAIVGSREAALLWVMK